MKLNTFDAVVKYYEDIKPIRGRRADEDIRPIGKRSRTYERVIKISDTKYGLSDGRWNYTPATNEHLHPITWERKPDGDYITIRNNGNNSASIGRYRFLFTYLPWGMRFYYGAGSGKHYVRYKDVDHYLPKFTFAFSYTSNRKDEITDDAKIVFKCLPDGTFERANELQPYKTGRINKDIDRQYITHIKDMWEWMRVVLPVLGDTLVNNRWEYMRELGNGYWQTNTPESRELITEILTNPEHEKRVALGALVAMDIGAVNFISNRFDEQPDSFTKFRFWARRKIDVYVREPR